MASRRAPRNEIDALSAQVGRGRVRLQLDAVERVPVRPRLVERGRADHDRPAAGRGGVHAGLVGERLEPPPVVGHVAPHVRDRGVVDRVGDEHDPAGVSGHHRRTWRSAGVTGSPSTSSRRAPSRSAHVTSSTVGRESGHAARRARPTRRRCRRSAPDVAPVTGRRRAPRRCAGRATARRRQTAADPAARRSGTGSARGPTRRRRPRRRAPTMCSDTSALAVPANG